MNYFLLIYVAGFIIFSVNSLYCFTCLLYLNHAPDKPDLIKIRPDLKIYLIIKPFLWPYYFVTEKSPLERISEFLFKHYGDKGHTYFGNHGIKNFLNDVFLGKNRYKNYHSKIVYWTIDKDSSVYQYYIQETHLDLKSLCAEITCAKYKNKYLLSITWKINVPESHDGIPTRFALDECKRFDETTFKAKLLELNSKKTQKLLDELSRLP